MAKKIYLETLKKCPGAVHFTLLWFSRKSTLSGDSSQKGPMAIAGYRSTAHQLSEIFTSCSILINKKDQWLLQGIDLQLISYQKYLLAVVFSY